MAKHKCIYCLEDKEEIEFKWVLCGCLTWYGQLTYIFKLGITDISISRFNVLPSTKMAYFNNEDRTISQDEAVYIYGGRNEDQYKFKV